MQTHQMLLVNIIHFQCPESAQDKWKKMLGFLTKNATYAQGFRELSCRSYSLVIAIDLHLLLRSRGHQAKVYKVSNVSTCLCLVE